MKQILQNLALIHLLDYCKTHDIDCVGTYIQKHKHGQTYELCRSRDGISLASVTFYRNQVPSYYINTQNGNITCIDCKKQFYGLEGKEDTCRDCLGKLMQFCCPVCDQPFKNGTCIECDKLVASL